jgi:hypothetical protein
MFSCLREFVFLSYSGDRTEIELVASELKRRKYRVFFDRDLEPASPYRQAISEAAGHADLFVFFVSEASVRGDSMCHNELSYARKSRCPVLPIQHWPAGEPMPTLLPDEIEGLQFQLRHGQFVATVCDCIDARLRCPRWRRRSVLLVFLLAGFVLWRLALFHYELPEAPLTTEMRWGLALLSYLSLVTLWLALVLFRAANRRSAFRALPEPMRTTLLATCITRKRK